MKKIIPIIILLVSCNSYENKMNKLLSQKKQLEDSLSYDSQNVIKYERLVSRTISDRIVDTSVLKSFEARIAAAEKEDNLFRDSISYFKDRTMLHQESIKNIVYSIDSLAKLK